MSALHLVLPRLWATAAVTGPNTRPYTGPDTRPLARATHLLTRREPAQTFVPGRRKGPHSLRLVQAQVQEHAHEPVAPIAAPAPRALPVRVQPQLAFYRKYTEAMLRRYLKLSMEAGRVPSLIGQDMFRGNVSHCSISGFDDAVIFVEDVSKCLATLSAGERFLVRRIAIEGHTMAETAAMKGISLRYVLQRYTSAVDKLTGVFLKRKLLNQMGDPDSDD